MSVEIRRQGDRHYEVSVERIGFVGHIYDFGAGPFKFKFGGDNWMKLTNDEFTAVFAATEPKLTLLNITKRLQG